MNALNVIRDVLSDLHSLEDEVVLINPIQRIVMRNWIRSLSGVIEELEVLQSVKSDLILTQDNLDFANRELQSLRERYTAIRGDHLRSTRFFLNLTSEEIDRLEGGKCLDEFLTYMDDRDLISAIKLWRKVFGMLGLKEAKDRVEAIRDTQPVPIDIPF